MARHYYAVRGLRNDSHRSVYRFRSRKARDEYVETKNSHWHPTEAVTAKEAYKLLDIGKWSYAYNLFDGPDGLAALQF